MLGPIRKIGKALRGGAHPLEIGMSVAMGVLAGVVLGKNGLVVILCALMLVLNTNKAAFGLTGVACGALGWLLTPLKFAVGRWALSVESLAGIFSRAANAPGGALCGFDTYLVAGGVIAGVPLAVAAGLVAAAVTRRFRSKMLALIGDPEKLNAWSRGRISRLVKWVLLGVGEADYEKSLSQRPKIIRKSGVVLLGLLVALLGVMSFVDYGAYVTRPAEDALTSLTGAEVNVAEVSLRPLVASLKAEGLALTDAADPATNAVEVGAIAADISVVGLTQRSIVIEEARITGVKFGTKRTSPGRVIRPPATKKPEDENARAPLDQAKSIETYIATWNEWKLKFEKLQDILETVEEYRGSAEGSEAAAVHGRPLSDEEVARLVEAGGYAAIRAPEIVRNVPDLLVKKLRAGPIATGMEGLESVEVMLKDLAYPVHFGPRPVSLTVRATEDPSWKAAGEKGPLPAVSLSFAPKVASEAMKLTGRLPGLPARKLSDALSSAVPVAFDGGKMDVKLEGMADASWIDLALDVTVVDFAAKSRGAKGLFGIRGKDLDRALAEMKQLRFKILVRGRPSRPRVLFRGEGLGPALKDAAVRAAKRRVQKEIDKQKEQLKEKLREKIDGETKGKLDGIMNDKGEDAKDAGKKLLEGIFKRK